MEQSRNTLGYLTEWDEVLEHMLSPALFNYELDRVAGLTFGNEEF